MENIENGPDIKRFGKKFYKDVEKAEELREKLRSEFELNSKEYILDPADAKEMAGKDDVRFLFGKNQDPWFPEERKDIAVVQRDWEDGHSKGKTAWYIVYNNGEHVLSERVAMAEDIHHYPHIKSVKIENGKFRVDIQDGEQKRVLKVNLKDIGMLG